MSEVSPDNETQKQEKETGSEGKISLIYSIDVPANIDSLIQRI